jgi:excisionase family DNA binding protein
VVTAHLSAALEFISSNLNLRGAAMFSVEIKFRAGNREVSLERFATLFLKELLQSAQDEIRPQPIQERVNAPVIRPAVVAAPASVDRKELEPLAVSLKQAAFLLGVKEPTIRKHMRQGTIPRVRVGKRVLVPMKAINDLVLTGAWSVENGEKK